MEIIFIHRVLWIDYGQRVRQKRWIAAVMRLLHTAIGEEERFRQNSDTHQLQTLCSFPIALPACNEKARPSMHREIVESNPWESLKVQALLFFVFLLPRQRLPTSIFHTLCISMGCNGTKVVCSDGHRFANVKKQSGGP